MRNPGDQMPIFDGHDRGRPDTDGEAAFVSSLMASLFFSSLPQWHSMSLFLSHPHPRILIISFSFYSYFSM
jgi:hypothetical protein